MLKNAEEPLKSMFIEGSKEMRSELERDKKFFPTKDSTNQIKRHKNY